MIFTFYSYKGGVGRSMALANVAQLFYEAGLKVLMVDWDLEAPGLERFFTNDVEKIHDNPGLIDMLLAYKQRMSQQPLERERDVLPFQKEKLDNYIVDVSPEIYGEGRILLLPAGRRPAEHFAEYASSVLTFDWDDFYRNWEGELFFEWLRQQLEQMADVVLIDSRTGVTEMGGVCTYQLADTIVMLCTTNQQSLDGTYEMARNFTHQEVTKVRRGRPINLLIVPARIERAESELLDKFKKEFIGLFKEFESSINEIDVNTFWQLGIPYIPKYAFTETIAVRESNRASAEDIAATFYKLSEVMGRLRLSRIVRTDVRRVARELAQALSKVNQKDIAEVIKLSSLIESFSEWMSEFPELLNYSRGLAHVAQGDTENALAQFRKASKRGQQIQVEGISLSIPEKIRKELVGSYDVFISYSHTDSDWVRDWLVPKLEEANLNVGVDYLSFDIGAPAIVNMERAVEQSRNVLLVLTPNWTESQWVNLETLLVQARNPSERSRRMLPLMLKECKPRKGISILTYTDFTKTEQWESQLERVIATIKSKDNPTPAVALQADSTESCVPFILPQLIPSSFAERGDTLAQLENLLLSKDEIRTNNVVALIGAGGVGKSALACFFAERHKDSFPDGIIGLRVDGKDVNVAAREFVLYCGEEIDQEDERTADTLMTEVFGHRRTLLILDNVEDASIQSLLPSGGRCTVIVTTRDRQLPFFLGIPQERMIDLPLLSDEESLNLLQKLLGEQRISTEAQGTAEIIRLTGNLPLALQIAGATVQMQESRSLVDYASSLRRERERLKKLKGSAATHLNVRASFALNIKLLTDGEIDFFACLSVCAKDGFSVRAAMAAGGCDETTAQELLGRLYRFSLMSRPTFAANRFVIHPLILIFAQELLLERSLQDVAAARHGRFFVDFLKSLDVNSEPDASVLVEELDDIVLAAEWLLQHEIADSQFILLLQPLLQQYGHWQKTTDLISGFLQLIENTEDWESVAQLRISQAKYLSLRDELIRAEEALRPVGDVIQKIESESNRQRYESMWLNTMGDLLSRQGRYDRAIQALKRSAEIKGNLGMTSEHALILNSLGGVLQKQGRFEEAVEALRRSATIEEELGNARGQAMVLHNLGSVLQRQGRFDEAANTFKKCLGLFEELEDQRGLWNILNDLGGLLQRQGRFDEAAESFIRSNDISVQLNDQRGQAMSLNSLGGVLQRQDRFDEAINVLQRSYEIYLEQEDQRGQAMVLNSLGGVLQRQSRFDEAVDVFQRSAVLEEALADLRGQAMVLNSLGNVLQRQGRFDEAVEALRRTARIEEELGNVQGQAMALNSLGGVLQRQGRFDEALETFQRSYELAESLGDQTVLAMILNSLGGVLQRQGQFDKAIDIFQQRIQLEEGSGNIRPLALAFNSLGSVLQQQGRYDEAISALQRSLTIYEQIGDERGLAEALINLGGAQYKQGNFRESLKSYQHSLDVGQKVGNERHLGRAYNAIGRSLLALGNIEAANAQLMSGFEIEEKLMSRRGIAVVAPLLIKNLIELQMREEASEYCRRALAIAPENKRLLELSKQFSSSENLPESNIVRGVIKAIIKHPRDYLYGFISPNEKGPDIYFHQDSVDPDALPKLAKGVKVNVEVERGHKGPRAKIVRLLN
jgi:tetratricopeptide (TPR) repeat protein/MinD-like ATPase involved in chromosome partitioning or flagellar assembly